MSPAGFAMSELSKLSNDAIRTSNLRGRSHGRSKARWRIAGGSGWKTCLSRAASASLASAGFFGTPICERDHCAGCGVGPGMKPWPRQRSIDAGRLLLQQSTPRGERLMARLQEAIQAGAAVWAFRDFVRRQVRGIFNSSPDRDPWLSGAGTCRRSAQ